MQLCEAYRPTVWSDVVGQDKVLATIERLHARGLGGRAYWLSGHATDRYGPDLALPCFLQRIVEQLVQFLDIGPAVRPLPHLGMQPARFGIDDLASVGIPGPSRFRSPLSI